MTNIIITAGGTIEDIDGVRKITNLSTGILGTLLCNEIIQYMEENKFNNYRIHYIVSETAIKPVIDLKHIENVIIYEVSNVSSVLDCIKTVMKENKIDYFIHSMAVSDFTTAYTIPINQMVKEINERINNSSKEEWESIIEEVLGNPTLVTKSDRKISSKSDLILGLKRTPKIISIIKEQNKDIYLVGFKLLKNVSEEELVNAANELAQANSCDLVFANDIQSIDKNNHKGLLIKDKDIIGRLDGKRNIAKAIVYQMFKGAH